MITLFQYYRIAAAFLIVMIHQQFWKPCAFINGLEGCAVPLFACMAGYLYKGGLLKKVPRVIIPYLIWAVIYFVANNVVLDVFVRHESFEFPGLKSWLLGGTACHLWFLPSLFAAFAAAEGLMRVRCLRGSEPTNPLTSITPNLILLALGIASQWLPGETSETFLGYCRIYFGRLLLFFSLGGLIRTLTSNIKHQTSNLPRITIKIMGGGAIMLGLANLALRFIPGLAFQPLLLIIGLMLLAVGFGEFTLPKFVGNLANATMGIYLVHVLFTSAANVVLAKLGHAALPAFAALPIIAGIFLCCYFVVRFMPKRMKG
ncbi:MAG: acyltransferase [Kiritimatiellae bacterium]|nr:acyltransferase [Kiritimatiellia bacterium]